MLVFRMQREYDSRNQRFPTSIIAVIVAAVAIVVVLVAVFAFASPHNSYYGGYGGYGWGGMMGGFGGVSMLIMFPIGLIFLVLIGYVVYRGVFWGGGCCGGHYRHDGRYISDSENSLEILRRRYARGEISKEQYEQMKKDVTY